MKKLRHTINGKINNSEIQLFSTTSVVIVLILFLTPIEIVLKKLLKWVLLYENAVSMKAWCPPASGWCFCGLIFFATNLPAAIDFGRREH